jgi:hypothetical protein
MSVRPYDFYERFLFRRIPLRITNWQEHLQPLVCVSIRLHPLEVTGSFGYLIK